MDQELATAFSKSKQHGRDIDSPYCNTDEISGLRKQHQRLVASLLHTCETPHPRDILSCAFFHGTDGKAYFQFYFTARSSQCTTPIVVGCNVPYNPYPTDENPDVGVFVDPHRGHGWIKYISMGKKVHLEYPVRIMRALAKFLNVNGYTDPECIRQHYDYFHANPERAFKFVFRRR